MTGRDSRAALEAAQARLLVLRAATPADDTLRALADSLEHEADSFETLLGRGERRALEHESPNTGVRVLAFGFSVLFMTPIVAMVGFSLARALTREPWLATASLCLGLALVGVSLSQRVRQALAHRWSADWELVRVARAQAAGLRRLSSTPPAAPSSSGATPAAPR